MDIITLELHKTMSNSELVDDYFCSVCDMPKTELDQDSLALVEIWHSFGLIQNGGIHSYLCEIGDGVKEVVDRYREVDLHKGGDLLSASYQLWREYWTKKSQENADPDEFRRLGGEELSVIEEDFYGLENDVVEALACIVQKCINNQSG